MSRDLVERLRGIDGIFEADEAADEIDRLQHEIDRMQQEIDRLQADKAVISQNASDYLHEIERLRQGKP